MSRKLRSYFHAHLIEVLTKYLLRQVLQKLEASSRLIKWMIELGDFDVSYHPRTAIKGQALADFIVEFTYVDTTKVTRMVSNTETAKVVEMGNDENSATRQEDAE